MRNGPIRNILRGAAQVTRGAVVGTARVARGVAVGGATVVRGAAVGGATVVRGGAQVVRGTAGVAVHGFGQDRCCFRARRCR